MSYAPGKTVIMSFLNGHSSKLISKYLFYSHRLVHQKKASHCSGQQLIQRLPTNPMQRIMYVHCSAPNKTSTLNSLPQQGKANIKGEEGKIIKDRDKGRLL